MFAGRSAMLLIPLQMKEYWVSQAEECGFCSFVFFALKMNKNSAQHTLATWLILSFFLVASISMLCNPERSIIKKDSESKGASLRELNMACWVIPYKWQSLIGQGFSTTS